jgi:hypothetical protein
MLLLKHPSGLHAFAARGEISKRYSTLIAIRMALLWHRRRALRTDCIRTTNHNDLLENVKKPWTQNGKSCAGVKSLRLIMPALFIIQYLHR